MYVLSVRFLSGSLVGRLTFWYTPGNLPLGPRLACGHSPRSEGPSSIPNLRLGALIDPDIAVSGLGKLSSLCLRDLLFTIFASSSVSTWPNSPSLCFGSFSNAPPNLDSDRS